MPINNDWTKEEKYKNKLNIKDDLQSYWEGKENIENNTKEETKEKKIKDNDIKIESYTNKKTNEYKETKFNLKYDDEIEDNKNLITKIILAAIVIITIGIFYMYNQEQKKIQRQAQIDKETLQAIKEKRLEEQRALRQQSQYYQNRNYENYKYFKVKYESDERYDYNFIYNIGIITNNLRNLKSKDDDNNYDIEISGNISKYGDFFYRIYKRKTSSEYDNQVYNMLSELKKIKFKLQEDTVNFKIYLNNNSYDLN